ncbi:MAG: serine/threonine-protein kinase [Planctomycetia bacterium]|nr:serine/threonine-protein kinase [Planctomycetia bacterium]
MSSQKINGKLVENETSGPTVITSRPLLTPVGGRAQILSTENRETEEKLNQVRIVGRFLEPGQMCNGFRLLQYIGGGGMGHVWLAEDEELHRCVALKVLDLQQNVSEDIILRFRAEAQAGASLNHPNIAQVYTFGKCQALNILYIAMEYVDGENIRDRICHRGALPVNETLVYSLQIAMALSHLDQFQIVHRDIKPSNILVTQSGWAKLIDLGLARQFNTEISLPEGDDDLNFPAQKKDLTATGVTLGTFDFISPEQAREPRTVDIRSDIYSLGCTMYYMLTGNPPFSQGGPLQKLLQHQGDAPPDIRRQRTDVPESFRNVIEKAMRKDRNERFQDTKELILALEKVAEETGFSLPAMAGYITLDWIPKEKKSIPMILDWNIWKGQLAWIVPLFVLLTAIFVLDYLWSPAENEMVIPSGTSIISPYEIYPESSHKENRERNSLQQGKPVPVPISPSPLMEISEEGK